jgi:GNAT superfamily N-acetyltransferase
MRATEFITESKIVEYEGIKLNVAIDGANIDIRALNPDGRQIGYVVFDRDGNTVIPDDVAVDEEYRGQGIAKTMYDYVKSLGFRIKASTDQTTAGKAFWQKHRGEERVWEEENLTELFQQGKNWKWEFKGSEEAMATFTVGDVEYFWHAAVENIRRPNIWTIAFRVRNQTDQEKMFGLTGTGNSAEVMSIVVDITRQFLQEYGDKVLELRFSSDNGEEGETASRTSLYARMVKRLLPNWNLHTKKVDTETDFYLTNPKAYEL